MRTLIGTTLVAVLIGFSGIIAVEAQTAAEVNKTLDELFGEHAPYQAFFEKLKKAVVLDRSPTRPRLALEFSGLDQQHGLAACADFMSAAGTLFPIAPCGRCSL